MKRLVCASFALLQCGPSSLDAGLDAQLQIEGATFVRGSFPPANGGPAIINALLARNTIPQSLPLNSFTGDMEPSATSAIIGFSDDVGYWIVPAGGPSTDAPNDPTFNAILNWGSNIQTGSHTLLAAAVDAAGNIGVSAQNTLVITASNAIIAPLVIALSWDVNADLDLHVVTPDGSELWRGHYSNADGYLDFDSNANCVIDGRRLENVVINTLESGTYIARVDTFSMCGQSEARFTVSAIVNGVNVAGASGVSLPVDTDYSHGGGAGVTMLVVVP